MNDRARTALVGVVLTLGFVSPFVAGVFADRNLRGIHGVDDGADCEFGKFDIAFLLDYDRSLARARVSRKPVLLYFTAENDAQPRRFEITVLKSPAVVARLREFECAAVVMDIVPHPDAAEAKRLYFRNAALRDELIERGWVRGPVLAVVGPDFGRSPDGGTGQPLAKALSWELNNDEATVIRFLDSALAKWSVWQKAAMGH